MIRVWILLAFSCCPMPVPPRPQPTLVVPSRDSHCSVTTTPAVPPVVAELAALPPDQVGTRAQLDELALYTAVLYEHDRRLVQLCASTAQPARP